MCRSLTPKTRIQKAGHARARNLRRDIVRTLQEAADDSGISRRALCRAAGIGPNTFIAIEREDREPTIEVLARLAAALGGELSLRYHPGTGPLVRDHLQAAMVETLIRELGPSWLAEPEVPVWTPTPGSIDVVLRQDVGSVVACEAQSELRRLEQQVRWARMKADALGARGSVDGGVAQTAASVSTLLLVRATPANAAVVARFTETLRAAYPAGHAAAVASLREGSPWPGAAMVWMEVKRGMATFRDSPPRGVPRW